MMSFSTITSAKYETPPKLLRSLEREPSPPPSPERTTLATLTLVESTARHKSAASLTSHVDHGVLLRRLDERIVLLLGLAHGILQLGLLEKLRRPPVAMSAVRRRGEKGETRLRHPSAS